MLKNCSSKLRLISKIAFYCNLYIAFFSKISRIYAIYKYFFVLSQSLKMQYRLVAFHTIYRNCGTVARPRVVSLISSKPIDSPNKIKTPMFFAIFQRLI